MRGKDRDLVLDIDSRLRDLTKDVHGGHWYSDRGLSGKISDLEVMVAAERSVRISEEIKANLRKELASAGLKPKDVEAAMRVFYGEE